MLYTHTHTHMLTRKYVNVCVQVCVFSFFFELQVKVNNGEMKNEFGKGTSISFCTSKESKFYGYRGREKKWEKIVMSTRSCSIFFYLLFNFLRCDLLCYFSFSSLFVAASEFCNLILINFVLDNFYIFY